MAPQSHNGADTDVDASMSEAPENRVGDEMVRNHLLLGRLDAPRRHPTPRLHS